MLSIGYRLNRLRCLGCLFLVASGHASVLGERGEEIRADVDHAVDVVIGETVFCRVRLSGLERSSYFGRKCLPAMSWKWDMSFEW